MHETEATISVSRPRQQRLRRRVAQALDLVVDRAVFLDVGVGRRRRTLRADSSRSTRRNTRPRCSGKNSRNSAHSCAASVLLWQSTSVGFCTSSIDARHRHRLAAAGDARAASARGRPAGCLRPARRSPWADRRPAHRERRARNDPASLVLRHFPKPRRCADGLARRRPAGVGGRPAVVAAPRASRS